MYKSNLLTRLTIRNLFYQSNPCFSGWYFLEVMIK